MHGWSGYLVRSAALLTAVMLAACSSGERSSHGEPAGADTPTETTSSAAGSSTPVAPGGSADDPGTDETRLTPPRASNTSALPSDGLLVVLDAQSLRIGERQLVTAAELSQGATVGPVAPLLSELEQARQGDQALMVEIDQGTPFRAVKKLLFTVAQSGYEAASIVVRDADGQRVNLGTSPSVVLVPGTSAEGDEAPSTIRVGVSNAFSFSGDGLEAAELSRGGGGPPLESLGEHIGAVEDRASRLMRVEVDDGIPFNEVALVVDTALGAGVTRFALLPAAS